MKPRYILLIFGLAACVLSIAFVMVKGNPQDRVSLDSIAEIGEGLLHSVHRAGSALTAISDKDEMAIGDKIHSKAFTPYGVKSAEALEVSDLARYINDIGSRITEHVKRKGIKYKFHIIEYYTPTAFAGPGGHIYITVGLLLTLKTESELAAVMAHEITHVDAKHCIGIIQSKVKADKVLGGDGDIDALADAGSSLIFRLGYSETQETEADIGGEYLLYQSGYHPYGAVYALERIDKESSRGQIMNTSATPIGDTLKAVGGIVGRYFDTHPAIKDRIDKIKRHISDRNWITDSSRFYVGQRNYEETVSYNKKRYKEEFRKDYPIIEDKKEIKDEVKKEEILLDQVYTVHGTVRRFMTVEEVEKMLPRSSQAFKYDTRIGYKNIMYYDTKDKGRKETAGLWIELANGMVRGIKIVK